MQYYPQHFFGFSIDGQTAEKLQLTEAFDTYEMSYEEEKFFEGFYNAVMLKGPFSIQTQENAKTDNS